MTIPLPPTNPDEHLMHERARRAQLDAKGHREQSWRGQRVVSTGDILLLSGLVVVLAVALLLAFVYL
jgi:hypothetical protein